jgi:hypothetical protein
VSRFVGTCPAPRHQIHAYADDGTRDHRGASRCGICALPAGNRLHKLPERSAEQREREARKLGEA